MYNVYPFKKGWWFIAMLIFGCILIERKVRRDQFSTEPWLREEEWPNFLATSDV